MMISFSEMNADDMVRKLSYVEDKAEAIWLAIEK